MEKLIEDFIVNNDLNLNDSGSGLNSTCCIIAGYCCYLSDQGHVMAPADIASHIEGAVVVSDDFNKEFLRVHEYAWNNSYGKYWESEDAKNSYSF